ncbi:MAG: hypothetical protein KME26_02375 [Oscillatoria princeps RMCB-10]|nr:hypothetical protein [Oscillatoria princeps RMCB-10]
MGGLCGNLEPWLGVPDKPAERRCGFLVSPAPQTAPAEAPAPASEFGAAGEDFNRFRDSFWP